MLRFSQAVEYGLLGLIELSKADENLALPELSKRAHVPENFLAKIFQKFQRAGVIESKRGKTGGFTFPEKSKNMNLWEIYAIVEGDTSLQKCVGESEKECECHRMYQCMVQEVWRDAQKSLEDTLKKWTLGDLINGVPTPKKTS